MFQKAGRVTNNIQGLMIKWFANLMNSTNPDPKAFTISETKIKIKKSKSLKKKKKKKVLKAAIGKNKSLLLRNKYRNSHRFLQETMQTKDSGMTTLKF